MDGTWINLGGSDLDNVENQTAYCLANWNDFVTFAIERNNLLDICQPSTSGEVSHSRLPQVLPAQPSAPIALPRQVAPSSHIPQFSTSTDGYATITVCSQPTLPSPGISYLGQPQQISHRSTRHPPPPYPRANYCGQPFQSQPRSFTAANSNLRQYEQIPLYEQHQHSIPEMHYSDQHQLIHLPQRNTQQPIPRQQQQITGSSYPGEVDPRQHVPPQLSTSLEGVAGTSHERQIRNDNPQRSRSNSTQQSSPPAAQNVKPEYNEKQKKKIEIFNRKTFTLEYCKAIGIQTFTCSEENCHKEYKIIKGRKGKMSCRKCNKEKKEIECGYCKSNITKEYLKFSSIYAYIIHCVQDHHDKKAHCYICNKKMTVQQLENHWREKRCEAEFYCIECLISFEHAIELADHKLMKHPDMGLNWICNGCGKDLKSEINLRKHGKSCEELKKSKKYLFKCPYPGHNCKKEYSSGTGLRHHFGLIQLLEKIRATPPREPPTPWEREILEGFTNEFFEDVGIETYQCSVCEEIYRYFPGKIKMTCHNDMEWAEIKCKQCDRNNTEYEIDSPRRYATHCQLYHKSSAPCYICGAETTSDNILEHLRPKNIQCLECLISFKNELLLLNHRYEVHPAGEHKWKCKKCRCEIEKSVACGKCKKNTEYVKDCSHCKTSMETNIGVLRHMKNQQMKDVDQENTTDVPRQPIDANKRTRDKGDDDPSEQQQSKK